MSPRSPNSKGNKTPLLAESQTSFRFIAPSDDHESFSIHQSPMVRLYDIVAALEISRDVADGYLILLSGGLNSAHAIRQQRNKKKVSSVPPPSSSLADSSTQSISALSQEELSAIQLAFFALTDGNAIDVLFGVKSMGGIKRSGETSEKAYNQANNAKRALASASAASDAIRLLAVETYAKCFEIIVKYHLELESLGFITWCFRYQNTTANTAKQIEELFRHLEESVASSS